MWIQDAVEEVCRKYNTRDPFEIATQRNIIVIIEPLGTIRGYYNRSYKQQFIHINQDLSRKDSTLVCAHELAHSILHPKVNTAFLRQNTFLSINKIEKQAQKFALLLCFSDELFQELQEYSVYQISSVLGIDEESARFRLEMFQIPREAR